MDCKTTFTKSSRSLLGFTLSELMISMAIGGIVLAIVTSLTFYSAKTFAAMANYADLDGDSRNALDRITRDIRECTKLISTNANGLSFESPDGVLTLAYDPEAKEVTRTLVSGGKTVDSDVLLTECDRFQFGLFSRKTKPGSYDQFHASSPKTCKLVQINWTCSRKIFGKRANTESVQTAKIVMRKQQS